jgi:HPt (histidine-containing phosphotransfer) domain-containing protein
MPDNEDIKSDGVPAWLEGDNRLLKGMREIFVRNTPQQMERLREAFNSGDTSTIELLSHTIKGSAAMIGAITLRDEAAKVEASALNGDIDGARSYLDRMEREFCKVISGLKTQASKTGLP